VMHGFRLIEST